MAGRGFDLILSDVLMPELTGPEMVAQLKLRWPELSVLFVNVRSAYVLTYVGDRPSLRSILWALGFLITTAIFFLPLIRNYLPV